MVAERADTKELSRNEFLSEYKSFFRELKNGGVDINNFRERIAPEEFDLFEMTYDLWCLKNMQGQFGRIPNAVSCMVEKGKSELSIEFMGPLGIGKSTA